MGGHAHAFTTLCRKTSPSQTKRSAIQGGGGKDHSIEISTRNLNENLRQRSMQPEPNHAGDQGGRDSFHIFSVSLQPSEKIRQPFYFWTHMLSRRSLLRTWLCDARLGSPTRWVQ